jgi:hypothetical protein
MLVYVIIMGVIGAIAIFMLRRTGKNEAISFSLKCKDCGFHKGILKCIHCEDRKRDKWR